MSDNYENLPRATEDKWQNMQISSVMPEDGGMKDIAASLEQLIEKTKKEWHTFTPAEKRKVLTTLNQLIKAFQ